MPGATKTWVELLLSYGATGLMAIAVVILSYVTWYFYRRVEALYETRIAEAKSYVENYQKLLLVAERLGEMVEEIRNERRGVRR